MDRIFLAFEFGRISVGVGGEEDVCGYHDVELEFFLVEVDGTLP